MPAPDRKPAAAPPAAKPPGPVLPVPPQDDEKYRYIRRGAWILTLASIASFPLLLFSQTRLMPEYHWFWFYLPFVVIGRALPGPAFDHRRPGPWLRFHRAPAAGG